MPLYLSERQVVATPLGDRLRFAGTLELAGLDLSVRWKRVQRIREGGDRMFPGTATVEPLEVWRGLRPCTPDGLPIIGRSPRHTNLVIATGHCMLGLGEGPITGRLVAQLVAGETPQIDLAPLRADRFLTPTRAARRSFERLAARARPTGLTGRALTRNGRALPLAAPRSRSSRMGRPLPLPSGESRLREGIMKRTGTRAAQAAHAARAARSREVALASRVTAAAHRRR